MIVPDGVTLYHGGRRYRSGEEAPNDLLPAVSTDPVAAPRKRPADEPARKG